MTDSQEYKDEDEEEAGDMDGLVDEDEVSQMEDEDMSDDYDPSGTKKQKKKRGAKNKLVGSKKLADLKFESESEDEPETVIDAKAVK